MKELWKKGMAGEQRGAFLVFTALAIWFLMMFVAFAVDFGNYYHHRSRLQNTADAAALAGVARYVKAESANNTSSGSEMKMGQGRLIGDDKVAPDNSSSENVDDYIQNNYNGNLNTKKANAWSETVEEKKTEDGKEKDVKTTHHYCRVDLVDRIPTFFARIFGVNTLDVTVSAVAMLDGSAESEPWGKRMQEIADSLKDTTPPPNWEDLENGNRSFSISDSKNPEKSSTGNKGLGKKKNRYYVTTGVEDALLGEKKARIKHEDENGIIIGYKEPEDGGICAAPIYLAEGISWEDTLIPLDDSMRATNLSNELTINDSNYRRCCPTTKIFNIADNPGVTTNGGKEIIALYLNRDHITNDNNDDRSGLTDRFTEINVGYITGTDKNKGEDGKTYVVPLYARLESETIRIGDKTSRAIMPVHGVEIHVNATRNELMDEGNGGFKENARPFVLAYDGPDPNRGRIMTNKDDPFDAPWIATDFTDLEGVLKDSPRDYAPAEIRQKIEPVVRKTYYPPLAATSYIEKLDERKQALKDRGLVESALTTSGPIKVNIGDGCMLYGAIYAPHSKVILDIEGNGCVHGFIIARQIEFVNKRTGYCYSDSASMPVWATVSRDSSQRIFDYEIKYVTANYEIAFDRYENFTGENYSSSIPSLY